MIAPPFTKRRQETCEEWLASLTDEEIRKRLRVGGGKDGFYGTERAWIEEHRLETLQTAATAPKGESRPNGADGSETERHGAADAADVHSPVRHFDKEDVPRPEPLVSEVPEFGMEPLAASYRYPVTRARIYPEPDPPAPAPDPLAELRAIAEALAARSAAGALPAQEVARFRCRLMRERVSIEALGYRIHGVTGQWRRLG